MDDESSSLKLKLYLLSSADAEQRQDQQQLSFKEKKYGRSTGRPAYAYGLTIGRNPYVLKIKPAKFSKRLETDRQLLERQYYKGGDGKHPVQIKPDVKSTSPRSRDQQGHAKKAQRRTWNRATEVPNNFSDANTTRGPIRSSKKGWRKYPNQINKPNQVMKHTPIKKLAQSGERHHQAMSALRMVIPGHYKPSEEVANMNKLDKSYFIKIKTSVNRVNSNTIVISMEAR